MEDKTISAGLSPEVKREKYWSELNDSEKIERLRTIIKQKTYFENQVSELQGIVQQLRREIFEHNHIENKVVVPMSEYPKTHTSTGLGLVGTLNPKSDAESYI